jgi:hypothetical protein
MDTAFAAARAASDPVPLPPLADCSASQPDLPGLLCLNSAITLDEVRGALHRLKNGKADGGDGLKGELLKYSGLSGIKMIHRLFNMIWHSEHIPAGWRKGRVVNLFKTGDATQCGSYRPITLLPVLDKLFSSILTIRLMQHVPLHDHQYAFGSTVAPINLCSLWLAWSRLANMPD